MDHGDPAPADDEQAPTSLDHADPNALPIAAVSSPSCRLPDFWTNNVRLWFVQAESEFALKGIRSESTKYHMTIRALSERDIVEIADIVANPQRSSPYQHLKQELLNRFQASTTERLQRLLSTEDLGDGKPSQLLRRLYALLGDKASSFDEDCLRELFLRRLPPSIRSLLAVSQTSSLQHLATLADKLMEEGSPVMAAVHSTNSSGEQSDLHSRLQALERSMENLHLELRATRPERRSPSPAPSTSMRSAIRPRYNASRSDKRYRSPPPSDSPFCWYHLTFGASARQCRSPCQWSGNRFAAR